MSVSGAEETKIGADYYSIDDHPLVHSRILTALK
jgi:hypothetical protein